jgi:4-hydroxy-3-methylbut-2-enyl diphosphate reductase
MGAQIKLANPRGFCAGVDRAIDIVSRALDIYGPPVYVRHEVVHNKFVVDSLRERGAIFVDELDEVPDDATCPLVTKVHLEVTRYSNTATECILIGHAGHPEVEGTMGQYNSTSGGDIYLVECEADVADLKVENPEALFYVTQTTLSMDDTAKVIAALREKFPKIQGPKTDDICYATQNRQDAVKQLALECDLVLVVGSVNSSNSNRLRELAERCGAQAYLVDNAADVKSQWLEGKQVIGVTAGASAPEILVKEVIDKLRFFGAEIPQENHGEPENISFSLPKELRSV